jgi:hypothetical protein
MNIQAFSEDIYGELKRDNTVAFDPMTLILITKVVLEIISAIRKCRKSDEEIAYRIKHPGVIEKLLVRRAVRKKLGVVRYLKNGRQMTTTILRKGTKLTHPELTELIRS